MSGTGREQLDQLQELAARLGETLAASERRAARLGRWLRQTSLDELPNLINVLWGEMSLVGPRPERPDVAAGFERKIPFYAFRYSVRPGLTGWAQIHLPYCARTEDHQIKLEFDLRLDGLRLHGGRCCFGRLRVRRCGLGQKDSRTD